MAWDGGIFDNSTIANSGPGTFVNFIVSPNATGVVSKRGYLAVPMELAWGTDEEVLEVSVDDYRRNCKEIFGYNYGAEELTLIDEMFQHATTVYFYRLNNGGTKAECEIAQARYSGKLGNKIELSVEIDPNAGLVDDPLKNITTEYTNTDSVVSVRYNNLPTGYKTKAILESNGNEVDYQAQDIVVDNGDETVTFTFNKKENATYTVKSYVIQGKIESLISTTEITTNFEPQTVSSYEVKENSTSPASGLSDPLENTTVTFTTKDNTITAKYSNIPEGYEPALQLKLGTVVTALQQGRIESNQTKDSITVTFYKDAPNKAQYSFIARVKNTSDQKYTTISTATFNLETVGEDKPETFDVTINNTTKEDYSEQIPGAYIVRTFVDQEQSDVQRVANITRLKDNNYVKFTREKPLEEIAGVFLTGGTDGQVLGNSHQKARDAFESYTFNILICPETDPDIQSAYIEYTRRMRDERGIKFQLVKPVADTTYKDLEAPNYEGIIEVYNEVLDDGYRSSDLVYWAGGVQAGCAVQSSTMATKYKGNLTVDANLTQDQLQQCRENGQFVLHRNGSDILVYKDINTFTTITEEDDGKRNEDFKYNQTVRVMDCIATDTANIFNSYYLGKFGNTEVNRIDLKGQFIKHRQELQKIGAISDYDESVLTLAMGKTIRDVVGWDAVKPINAMERLFFTVQIIDAAIGV